MVKRTKNQIKTDLKQDLKEDAAFMPVIDEKKSALIEIISLLEAIEENTRKV